MIALGLFVLIAPALTPLAAAVVLGWVLVAAGFTQCLFGSRSEGFRAVLWRLFVGTLYVWTGFLVLTHPLWTAISLAIVVSATLLVEGAVAIFLYLFDKTTSGWLFGSGLITVIFAAILAGGWPWRGVSIAGTLVGLNLVMNGVARLAARQEVEG